MLSLAPPAPAAYRPLPKVKTSKARSSAARVAFMQGCIQRVFFGDVNAATVRVLTAEGWEVHSPRSPRCCGALQMHAGVEDEALPLAEATIAAYEGYDQIVTNVAGCGSVMKDYGHLSRHRGPSARGVLRQGRRRPRVAGERRSRRPCASRSSCAPPTTTRATSPTPRACALQPRELLRGIPGLELLEPAEWELCCGSAGIYNLLQPEAAGQAGRAQGREPARDRRRRDRRGQPGCALQIATHLDLPIYHPMTLLDMSLRGVQP